MIAHACAVSYPTLTAWDDLDMGIVPGTNGPSRRQSGPARTTKRRYVLHFQMLLSYVLSHTLLLIPDRHCHRQVLLAG